MKKVFKRAGALFTAFIVTLASAFSYFAVNAVALDAEKVRTGVVAVVYYLTGAAFVYGDNSGSLRVIKDLGDCEFAGGTGFFVGPDGGDAQYIVTNHHVVVDFIDNKEGQTVLMPWGYTDSGILYYLYAKSSELRVYYSQTDYENAYVDCYGDQEKVDLAVLRLRKPTTKRHNLPLAAINESNVSDTVYSIGYPGIADNVYSAESKYGVEDSTVHKGSIGRFVYEQGKGVERVCTDAKINHGNSGGPLVNEAGQVVGVNTNGITEDVAQEFYAITSNELIRFLEKNNIPFEKAGASSGSTPSGNGGGTGSDTGTDTGTGTTPAPAANNGNGDNTLLIIIIACSAGVVVIGIIIALVVVNSKKKAAPAMQAPAPQMQAPQMQAQQVGRTVAAQQQPSQAKAVIRSMSMQHNGRAFPVGKAPVGIGRNTATCVIVYAEGTAGVSGNHCTVSFDSATGLFTLTDVGSSYGTFLMGGQKLAPNTPVTLHPGESFYVGDKQNVLRVELER